MNTSRVRDLAEWPPPWAGLFRDAIGLHPPEDEARLVGVDVDFPKGVHLRAEDGAGRLWTALLPARDEVERHALACDLRRGRGLTLAQVGDLPLRWL